MAKPDEETPLAWWSDFLACPRCEVIDGHPLSIDVAEKSAVCSDCGLKCELTDKNFVGDRGNLDVKSVQEHLISSWEKNKNREVFKESSRFEEFRKSIRNLITSDAAGSRQRIYELLNSLVGGLRVEKSPLKVMIVGSHELGCGVSVIRSEFDKSQIQVVGFDLIESEFTDLTADAHAIPFLDDIFDVVICQAVLEHVINPEMVVSEIFRVLAPGGFVYSEVPFLQQVHASCFDFSRFTLMGHLLLFKNFHIVRYGRNKGHLYVLAWWVKYAFGQEKFPRLFGNICAIPFFIFAKFIDPIFPQNPFFSASGTYVLAAKDTPQSVKERLTWISNKD